MASLLTSLLTGFAADCQARPKFFGLVPWYNYLPYVDDGNGGCKLSSFTTLGPQSSFLLIGLAIVDDLLRVAALVSVGFVIYGGIEYITSQGSPDSTKKAQQTIINALIGLVVALLAVGLVSFIGSKLGS